ncbi:MAG TPA: Ldh family oxidoreductase, partial [Candidatus Polarisedimenticolaceae bacterium]|nr:Ldh family oxidoreductase [Candidatus Polarisedimenticolaceae bacterium]
MKIGIHELHQKVIATLSAGFSQEEASLTADYLVWAEMAGVKTQGLVKLTGATAFQHKKPQHEIKVERDTKLSQLIDGGDHLSPYVSQVAVKAVVAKAKGHGIGIVGVHNAQSSNGAQAFYAAQIADKDLIGISLARTPASAAAFGGIDAVFGTDPIGFSFPTKNEPLTFDMATTAMTVFGLIIANAKGEPIPENMAIDKDGNPTTDPGAALDGALLSFDRSYKGSGMGMVVEILGGPLVGAAYGQVAGEWGNLFIAIDPELFVDIEQFKANVSDLMIKLMAARKAQGIKEIRLPG